MAIMNAALLGSLVVLALIDSTSFGTLGVPLVLLLASERAMTSRLMLYLGTIAAFYFLVGLALTAGVIELATMVPYLAAIGLMTTADLPAAKWLVLLAGYVIVMILPALLLLIIRLAARDWAEPKLQRLRAWITKHAATAVSWTIAIVGIMLALNAVGHLFGDETGTINIGTHGTGLASLQTSHGVTSVPA